MKFAASQWLWVLLALPPAYWLLAWDERRRRRQFGKFADEAVWRAIVPEADWGARLRKGRIWLIALGFVILALARPQWGSHEEVVRVTGLDILVALDISNSMETEDVSPSRLKKARHLIKTLAERLSGDRMGIVAFAGSSYLASPLTTDIEYVLNASQVVSPRSMSNQGTDIGAGLENARKALDRGAEEADPSKSQDTAGKTSRVIILISDGEDHEEGATEAARKLKTAGIKLYVIGVGTQKGGPIPLRDDAGNLVGYKRDRKGSSVVSTFKPDALVALAAAAGGRYWNATAEEAEIDELLRDVGGLNRSDYAERRFMVYEERFQFPLAIAVLLLLFEISLPVRRLRRAKAVLPVRADSSTRTSVPVGPLAVILVSAFLLVRNPVAQAKQPQVEAYFENEKGLKAYQEGRFEEAKKSFGSAQALDPSLPELDFNRGVIQLEEGDIDSAVEAFGRAAKNPALEGRSSFNQGVALGKKGDVENAVKAYMNAIVSAQRDGDSRMEEDARKNIELLMRQRQQQKQQQQQQQEQQQQDQQAQNQQKPKQYKDDSKEQKRRQFKSEKFSKEDAERVMSELTNKDRELQTRLNKQNGNAQASQKDW